MGILNGSNLPGTPCIIPGTILIGTWSASCVCDTNSTYYDCLGILNGPNLPNTPCVTFLGDSGFWNANCVCTMALNNYDCLGILNGPNMPGTSCNDGDTLTTNDTWNGSCVCTGTSILPCQANFWVLQAFGIDSLPVPYELWVWNLSSGGTGVYTFLWSFGDGTSSTDAYPTHTYANSGPYVLCLTIADNGGCTSTFCDSIAINTDGIYTGIMGGNDQRSAGFTINIQNPLSNEVVEHVTTDAISIWPNPVSDALNVALVSTMRGELVSTIIDLDGKVMWSGTSGVAPGRNQMIVPVESLAPGLYVIRINNGTQSTALRFVKR